MVFYYNYFSISSWQNNLLGTGPCLNKIQLVTGLFQLGHVEWLSTLSVPVKMQSIWKAQTGFLSTLSKFSITFSPANNKDFYTCTVLWILQLLLQLANTLFRENNTKNKLLILEWKKVFKLIMIKWQFMKLWKIRTWHWYMYISNFLWLIDRFIIGY